MPALPHPLISHLQTWKTKQDFQEKVMHWAFLFESLAEPWLACLSVWNLSGLTFEPAQKALLTSKPICFTARNCTKCLPIKLLAPSEKLIPRKHKVRSARVVLCGSCGTGNMGLIYFTFHLTSAHVLKTRFW